MHATLPIDSPAFFSSAIDLILGHGVDGAREIAERNTTDPRVARQLRLLLAMSANDRAGIVGRNVRRSRRLNPHPAQTWASDFEFESRSTADVSRNVFSSRRPR